MGKRVPIFLGILLICLAVWALITPTKFVRLFIERLDHIGYDIQLRTRLLTHKTYLDSPVAIIDIDDKSLKIEGRWPWPRDKLAKLTDALAKQGAAVIAFDIFFSEKQPNIAETFYEKLQANKLLTPAITTLIKEQNSLFDDDLLFAKSLSETASVLPVGFLPHSQTQNTLPPPLLTLSPSLQRQLYINEAKGYISNLSLLMHASKGSGFINIFPDNDGIIRHAPLIMEYQGKIYPALALQAVMTLLNEKVSLITPSYGDRLELEGIQLGNTVIPTDAKGQVLIPFIGKSYTFPYYSATDVLHGSIPKDALLGKILFVGTSATGLGDLHATAVQNPFPGVEIQATLVNGILQKNFSYIPAWTLGANLFLVIFFGLLSAFIFPYFGPRTLSAVILFLPPILLLINNWIWAQSGLVLSLLIPVILVLVIAVLNIVYGYLFETRKRERLKEMFGQYVPEKHIDEMIQTTSDYGLHGEDRDMSVLFADIRNFTTISEGMPASELVDMLNTFFTPMTEIIFKHRGTIDKYVGDMIMAFWSAPLKDKHHARHAIQSAIEMQAKVNELQKTIQDHHWPEIKIGIGINSGIMSVGDMGSRFRRNYTVLGDEVNLASRIEGLTKFYGADIIVTENTQRDQTKFIFRKLDLVKVKGKQRGIAIYEVLGFVSQQTPALIEELDAYHQALSFYFEQKWDEAAAIFSDLHHKHAETKIYKIYLDRIAEFRQHPLPADWDGVYVHKTK